MERILTTCVCSDYLPTLFRAVIQVYHMRECAEVSQRDRTNFRPLSPT